MFRLVGQFLAIVAVMASAVNAQCALSCSMQGMTGNAPHQAHIAPSRSGAHACCPAQNAPAPNGKELPQQQQPCPIPVVTAGEIVAANSIQYSAVAQVIDGPTLASLDQYLPVRRYAPSVFVDSSGIPDVPAFAILRI
jgi:hypothetical protein